MGSNNSDTKPNPHAHRIPVLDTFRAVAILWVVLLHLSSGKFLPPGTPGFLRQVAVHGDAGVDLFFILSGYLISSIILNEVSQTGGLRVRRFWQRRWFRTLPAYYAVLAILLLGDYLILRRPWDKPWAYVVFLQTYLLPENGLRFGWSWSLCVEEMFYLCLPILVALTIRVTGKKPLLVLRTISLVAWGLSFVSRIFLDTGTPTGHPPGYFLPHCRLDGLAMGVIISTLPPLRSVRWSLALGVAALASLALFIQVEHAN